MKIKYFLLLGILTTVMSCREIEENLVPEKQVVKLVESKEDGKDKELPNVKPVKK